MENIIDVLEEMELLISNIQNHCTIDDSAEAYLMEISEMVNLLIELVEES